MKNFIYFLALCCAVAFSAEADTLLADKYGSFSVLGDSFSTFKGYNDPVWNTPFFPRSQTDVTDVEQTWWKLFENETGIRLEQNNSFSGSAVCTYGKNNTTDLNNSFVGRVSNLREAGLIIVEGATNDNTFNAPVGEYVWSDFSDAAKRTYRGGTAYVIDYLQKKYPKSTIVFMLNYGLSEDINSSTEAICEHYGIPLLKLSNMSKKLNHPDVEGMKTIKSELSQFLYDLEGITYISEDSEVSVKEGKENACVVVDKIMAAGEWSSACFPFSLSESQIASVFGAGAKVQTIEGVDGTEVKLAPVSVIDANRPYVINPELDLRKPFRVKGVKLEPTAPVEIKNSKVTVKGSYRPREGRLTRVYYYTFDRTGNLYNDATPGWMIPALTVNVMVRNTVVPTGSVQEESGIGEIEAENGAEFRGKGIYDLHGRSLDRIPAPGIYVIDGRKTIVR